MNTNNIKAFFFDMDGVIFDSMPRHALAWEQVMQKYNLDFTARDCYINEGRTGEDVIIQCYKRKYNTLPDNEFVKQVYKEKSDAFSKGGSALPIPYIEQVLQLLKQMDIQIWIVTGSGQQSLFDNLNLHFPDVFRRDRMITAFDVKHGKPNPEPYLKAWEKSCLKKNECVVVENAPLGVVASKAAGIFTIAVNTGVLTTQDLKQAGADLVLDNMLQLLQWIKTNLQGTY